METFFVLTEFFGGIILLLGFTCLIGHLLKLDKYYEEYKQHHLSSILDNDNDESDNGLN